MGETNTPPDSATTAIEDIYRTESGRASYSKKDDDFGDDLGRASTIERASFSNDRAQMATAKDDEADVEALGRVKSKVKEIWKFRLRPADDAEPR